MTPAMTSAMTPPVDSDGDRPDTPAATRILTDKTSAYNQGWTALSYLLAGVLFYGGLGWLGDRWLSTGFLLPIGIIAGAAIGVFLIIRRFGAVADETAPRTGKTETGKTSKTSTSNESEAPWEA